MRPITKAVFELIYNDNIFHAFREVIPSLRHSKIKAIHCVKSACIPSYSGLYFPAFGLGISSYSVRMRENADHNNSEWGHRLYTDQGLRD